jgi:hypothetical protein
MEAFSVPGLKAQPVEFSGNVSQGRSLPAFSGLAFEQAGNCRGFLVVFVGSGVLPDHLNPFSARFRG